MCQGISALIEKTTPWLVKYGWPSVNRKIPKVEEMPNQKFIRSALGDLASLSEAFAECAGSKEDTATFEEVVENLTETYSLLAAEILEVHLMEQRIVTILHRVPVDFISLLEHENPMAMALLARNLSLFVYLAKSPAWWIHGTGDHKVYFKAVWGIHSLMPSRWLWTMDFPLKVISQEISLDSS